MGLEYLETLEKQLLTQLHPVKPDQTYVERVGDRLRTVPQVLMEHRHASLPVLGIFAALLLGAGVIYVAYTLMRRQTG